MKGAIPVLSLKESRCARVRESEVFQNRIFDGGSDPLTGRLIGCDFTDVGGFSAADQCDQGWGRCDWPAFGAEMAP